MVPSKHFILKIRLLATLLMLLPVLSACAKSDIAVSIHGVNYSADTVQYFIIDPDNKKNVGGGETVDPYSAGGTMCCFSLPKKWKPGIKIQINATYWPPTKEGEKLKEFSDSKIVELPRYAAGKPGELWVVRGKKGELSVVSSDYQPDHVNWPGSVKGWPVPSLEYQRERWDLYIKHEQDGVYFYEKLLKELEDSPAVSAKEAWDFSKKDNPASLVKYSGPDDIKYLKELKDDYQESLEKAKKKTEILRKQRP